MIFSKPPEPEGGKKPEIGSGGQANSTQWPIGIRVADALKTPYVGKNCDKNGEREKPDKCESSWR